MSEKKILRTLFTLALVGAVFGTSHQLQAEDDLDDLFDEAIGADVQELQRKQLRPKKILTPRDRREFSKISELQTLAPFKDVAIISRKFSPRTKRAEFSAQVVLFGNNNYAHSLGVSGHLAWYFTEKMGLEMTGAYLGKVARPIANALRDINIVPATVTPETFFGGYFKWSPFYGKMSYFEKGILYFDMPLKIGMGITNAIEEKLIQDQKIVQTDVTGLTTFSFGISPTWNLNKSLSVRLDVLANYYSKIGFRTPDNLLISAGLSYFFPEVTYR